MDSIQALQFGSLKTLSVNLKLWVPAAPRSRAGSSQQMSRASRGLSSNIGHSCAQQSAPGQMRICSWTPSCFGFKSQASSTLVCTNRAVFYPPFQANATSQPALSSSPSLPEGPEHTSFRKAPNPQVVQSCHKGGAISPAEDKITH